MKLRLLALVLLAGCATPRVDEPRAPAAPVAEAAPVRAEPVPPALRLPGDARPIAYRVSLTIDPRQPQFAGSVEIDTELLKPIDTLWLHAKGLEISDARLRREGGGADEKLEVISRHPPFLGLRGARELAAGKGTLSVTFTGRHEERGASGLFRQNENGEWYSFTQMEAEYARQAFPSFDEPSYKVPFTLSLTVPSTMGAFANNPVESETAGPGEGMKTVRFKQTPPLPTYLIAFAVGPFEVVEAGTGGQNKTPLRIIVTRGKTKQAEYAVKDLQQQLPPLEAYFGQPYPYEKLDLLEIPLTGTFGAMENPGLVTFVASLMLADPKLDTVERQRRFARVNAHELAHMWFGDLVTPAWWDDIWLNEAFATWMARKAIEAREPSWNMPVERVESLEKALDVDALLSARQIRQPIRDRGDIVTAFDRITYEKGGAVLDMFEAFIGEERFREGVRHYTKQYAHGVATADDFFGAISAAAGQDVKAAANTFIERPGSPVVSFELECAKGKAPALKLGQQRYVELGAQLEGETPPWSIPVCVRYGGAKGEAAEACTMLSSTTGELALTGAKSCPAWVFPNAKAKGYYRSELKGDLMPKLQKVARAKLTGAEQMVLILDAQSAMRAGVLPADEALSVVERLLPTNDRGVLSLAVKFAAGLEYDLIPVTEWRRHARMVRKLFGAKAAEVGLADRPQDDADTRLLRSELIGPVALRGEDPKVTQQARALAEKWLAHPEAVSPDLAETILSVAAAWDDAFNERLREALGNTRDRRARGYLMAALGSTRSRETALKNLAILLDPKVDPRESIEIVEKLAEDPRVRASAYVFVKAHYDAYSARFTDEGKLRIPRAVASHFCDAKHRADVEAFFGPRIAAVAGGQRVLAQTLERIDACIAVRKAQEQSVAKFLARY